MGVPYIEQSGLFEKCIKKELKSHVSLSFPSWPNFTEKSCEKICLDISSVSWAPNTYGLPHIRAQHKLVPTVTRRQRAYANTNVPQVSHVISWATMSCTSQLGLPIWMLNTRLKYDKSKSRLLISGWILAELTVRFTGSSTMLQLQV